MPTLNWIGKEAVLNHHQNVPFKTLEQKYTFPECAAEAGNKIIHGDNLEALKALLPEYEGIIKCIYIDPPYNTGNENWVYNDNVNSPKIQKWLGQVVGKEAEDLSRHDKWLCMMYPRLQLLQKLLADDGAIFISIDDNEQANLKLICDEIFGAGNFVANLPTIMNLKGNQDEFGFAGTHEYTLVYAKNVFNLTLNSFPIDEDDISDWLEDSIGFYKKGATLKRTGQDAPRRNRPNGYYPILVDKETKAVSTITEEEFNKIYNAQTQQFDDAFLVELGKKYFEKGFSFLLPITDSKSMSWRWQITKVRNEAHKIIVVGENGNFSLYKKQRPEIGDLPSKKPKSFFYKPEYSSGNGTAQLKNIFAEKIFNNPKPIELIKDIIQIATDRSSIILDSFAGSGTTAHAVLNLNKQDGGNRQFILVEMEDYAENITAERVRRVIKGYGEGKNAVEGTGGSFSYYELGEALFKDDKNLNEAVGVEKIRKYIWYSETHTPYVAPENTNYFLGTHNATDYYFYYEPDRITTLSYDTLNIVMQKAEQYVIYADCCLIDKNNLLAKNIIFKKIPRDIRRF